MDYIRANPEIRDVLITGGDPLTLEDERIDRILAELSSIPHVAVKRIGSATPATLPQTKELRDMSKYLIPYPNFCQ